MENIISNGIGPTTLRKSTLNMMYHDMHVYLTLIRVTKKLDVFRNG